MPFQHANHQNHILMHVCSLRKSQSIDFALGVGRAGVTRYVNFDLSHLICIRCHHVHLQSCVFCQFISKEELSLAQVRLISFARVMCSWCYHRSKQQLFHFPKHRGISSFGEIQYLQTSSCHLKADSQDVIPRSLSKQTRPK